MIDTTGFSLIPLLPEIFMALSAMGLLVAGVCEHKNNVTATSTAALIAVLISVVIVAVVSPSADQVFLFDMFKSSDLIVFGKYIILFGLAIILALSLQTAALEHVDRFEFPVLLLLAGIGMLTMIAANHFLTFYLGLELQSLSLYILAAIRRNSVRATEAGVKYFTLGALSSGFMLFGISLVYGFSGTLNFDILNTVITAYDTIPLGMTFGVVFIMAGLAFKLSAAPFHMWTPDVYQGVTTLITSLFAIVPKAAVIIVLMRFVLDPFAGVFDQTQQILYALSILSMIVGAIGALNQTNIKRILAYSAIGNVGYILMGVIAGTAQGIGASLLYLIIYMVMSAGVFSILLYVRRNGATVETLKGLRGFSKTKPLAAYAMAILMFSMSGIPPLAGFFGKFFVFKAAIDAGHIWLALIGIMTSVIATFYYLKIIKVMFFDTDEHDIPFDRGTPRSLRIIAWISVLFVVFFIFKAFFFVGITTEVSNSLEIARQR